MTTFLNRWIRADARPSPVPAGPGSDPFAVDRLTPTAIAVHAAGGLVSAAVVGLAIAFPISHPDAVTAGWRTVAALLVALVVASFVGDLVSGLLHWAFDTYFSEHTVVRRMVVRVREHHVYPDRIFRYGFLEDAGLLSWFAAAVAAPAVAVAWFADALPLPVRGAVAVGAATVALQLIGMAELHKFGHRKRRGRVTRGLQRARLLLSPEHHLRHHAGAHDSHYCLVNGWADDTLGRLGLFRALERAIAGVMPQREPRANDLEWQRRAGGAPATDPTGGTTR